MGKKLPPSQTKYDQHESVKSPLIRRVVATPLNHHRSASEAPKFPSICNLPVVNVIPSTLGVAAVAVDAVVACLVVAALARLPVPVVAPEGVHRVVQVVDRATPRESAAEPALQALLRGQNIRRGVLLAIAGRNAGELVLRAGRY